MRPALRTAIWLSVLALGTIAAADGLSVKRIPKQGDSTKYTMSVEFQANGGRGTIEATLLEQVSAVDKDGNYTVQQTQIDAKGTFDAEEFDIPARPPITMTYKPNRTVTSIVGSLIDADSYRVETLATVIDPGKDLKVGDVWTEELKEDKTLGTKNTRLEYKLIGEEKVGNIDTLKIKGMGKETEGVNTPLHEFTIWLSKADGVMIQLESRWTNAPFPGVSAPVSATIKITKAAA